MKYKIGDTLTNGEDVIRICGISEVKQTYRVRTIRPKKRRNEISLDCDEWLDKFGYKLLEESKLCK